MKSSLFASFTSYSCIATYLIVANAIIVAQDNRILTFAQNQHDVVNDMATPIQDAGSPQQQQTSSATASDTAVMILEPKDAIFDSTTKLDSEHSYFGAIPYIDMGGIGSWVEFHVNINIDEIMASNSDSMLTPCQISFLYANGASNRRNRPCSISIDGIHIGVFSFSSTEAWTTWRYEHITTKCIMLFGKKGTTRIVRLTATTEEGGPNIERMELTSLPDSSSDSKEGTIKTCTRRYKKLPAGQITYGLDDGGCYLCMQTRQHQQYKQQQQRQHHPFMSSMPSSGSALTEQCQQKCDEDTQCIAFTVARTASLPSQLYHFGKISNCCLERRRYPTEVYLNTQPPLVVSNDEKKSKNIISSSNNREGNSCELDSMCWTRYERIIDEADLACALESPTKEGSTTTIPSRQPSSTMMMCLRVWESTTYTDEEIQNTIDFINDGCRYQDSTYESMLIKANAQCKDEIIAESLAITVLVHSTGTTAYVSVGQ